MSVIVVYTYKTAESLIAACGSGKWKLDIGKARKAKYLVCVRNKTPKPEDHGTVPNELIGPEQHQSAFLVARITGIEPSDEANRSVVLFDRYARVSIPDVWKGWRYPVRYLDSLGDLGILEADLEFLPTEDSPSSPAPAGGVRSLDTPALEGHLTIAEAKRRLARTFGVAPDAIDITIRG
jgi:hypothetical protein